MKIEEMIARWPQCRPLLHVGGWALWVLDERWRLPYRWYEWRKYAVTDGGGFGLMVLGGAVVVTRLRASGV